MPLSGVRIKRWQLFIKRWQIPVDNRGGLMVAAAVATRGCPVRGAPGRAPRKEIGQPILPVRAGGAQPDRLSAVPHSSPVKPCSVAATGPLTHSSYT